MDRLTRVRIQEQFQLAKDPDAMALPLALNEKIWTNRPIDKLVCPNHLGQLTEQEMTRTARQIVAMMPCWLVYQDTMKIVSDVRELLNQRNDLFPVS